MNPPTWTAVDSGRFPVSNQTTFYSVPPRNIQRFPVRFLHKSAVRPQSSFLVYFRIPILPRIRRLLCLCVGTSLPFPTRNCELKDRKSTRLFASPDSQGLR